MTAGGDGDGGEGGGGVGGGDHDGPGSEDEAADFLVSVEARVKDVGFQWREETKGKRGMQIYQIKAMSTDTVKLEEG